MPLPPPPCRRRKGVGSTQRCRGPIALRAITREAAERSRGGVLREAASLPEQVASAGEVRPTSPPPHGAAVTTAGSSRGLPAAISKPREASRMNRLPPWDQGSSLSDRAGAPARQASLSSQVWNSRGYHEISQSLHRMRLMQDFRNRGACTDSTMKKMSKV